MIIAFEIKRTNIWVFYSMQITRTWTRYVEFLVHEYVQSINV